MYRKFGLVAMFGVAACVCQSALAGVILNVTPAPDPGPGFRAFNVSLEGTEGLGVGGVVSVNLTGAHQIWQNAAAGASSQTPVNNDTSTGVFGKADWNAFDSHLLVNPRAGGDNVTTSPGFGMLETNDGSNPGGLPADFLAPSAPFNTFVGTAGNGNLSFTGVDPTIAWLNPQPAAANLAYVVVAGSAQANLSLRALDSRADVFYDLSAVLGAPVNADPIVGDKDVEWFSQNPPVANSDSLSLTDDGPAGVWSIESFAQPNGNAPSIDPVTGVFTWIGNGSPEGVYPAVLRYTDGGGLSDTGSLNITWHIPEPSTFALFGLALVGFASCRRK